MKAVVVIPVYKSQLNDREYTSFEACCRILRKYTLCLVTYNQFDDTVYCQIARLYNVKLQVEYFEDYYFKNIHGYNRLMLSADFYHRFDEFRYMLVYQLDAYVFRDELQKWCGCDFDYIGAPLFAPGFRYSTQYALVGNGGFSLRKTQVFESLFHTKLTWHQLLQVKYPKNPYINWRKKIVYTLMLWALGRFDGLFYFLTYFVDEDRFFSCALLGTSMKLSVPPVEKAMFFAFDQGGAFWFDQTKCVLPFGVHAWSHDSTYKNFYCRFIPLQHE